MPAYFELILMQIIFSIWNAMYLSGSIGCCHFSIFLFLNCSVLMSIWYNQMNWMHNSFYIWNQVWTEPKILLPTVMKNRMCLLKMLPLLLLLTWECGLEKEKYLWFCQLIILKSFFILLNWLLNGGEQGRDRGHKTY